MKRTLFAALLTAVLAQAAQASIYRPESGNGELFLAVNNAANQVSYIFDTGIRMDEFIGFGENPGLALNINIGSDPAFQTFAAAASSLGESAWAVLAYDNTGGAGAGFQRLLTTARQEAGGFAATVDRIGTTTNANFSLMVNSAASASFFDAINTTGTHGVPGTAPNFEVDGSSFNPATIPGNAYFGRAGGLTPTFNGVASFTSTTFIGQSASGFYALSRSSTLNGANNRVVVNPFQNGSEYATWTFDGTTLSYAVPVPEPTSVVLLMAGLIGMGAFIRRRRQD